jgi:hypothetical protein
LRTRHLPMARPVAAPPGSVTPATTES